MRPASLQSMFPALLVALTLVLTATCRAPAPESPGTTLTSLDSAHTYTVIDLEQDYGSAQAINSSGQVVGTIGHSAFANLAFVWDQGTLTIIRPDYPAGVPTWTVAAGNNDQGQVIGNVEVNHGPGAHGFLWNHGTMTDLALPGGTESFVTAINARGQVIGSSTSADGSTHAFLWNHGVTTDLGVGYAVAINDAGQVVVVNGAEAFLWTQGSMTDLGTLSPVAINDQGQVIGYAGGPFSGHAALWDDGATIGLGSLGGGATYPRAINSQGQVVGWSKTAGGDGHAFLWEHGAMTDLGTLGGQGSVATALNDDGQVAGTAETDSGYAHAFLWDNGTMFDLGGRDTYAAAISARGDVAGSGFFGTGDYHAVVWVR